MQDWSVVGENGKCSPGGCVPDPGQCSAWHFLQYDTHGFAYVALTLRCCPELL